jgi:hypothetical protein
MALFPIWKWDNAGEGHKKTSAPWIGDGGWEHNSTCTTVLSLSASQGRVKGCQDADAVRVEAAGVEPATLRAWCLSGSNLWKCNDNIKVKMKK